jgi:hypothetical protein
MAKDGEIDFKIINDALIAMTSNGGMFEGRMASISRTLQGRTSNLSDSFFKLGRALVKNLLPILSDVVYNFTQVIEVMATFMEYINEEFPSAWRWALRGLALVFFSMTGPIGAAVAAIYLIVDDLVGAFQGRNSVLGNLFHGMKYLIGSLFDFTMQKINEVLAAIQPVIDLYNLYAGQESVSVPYAQAIADDPSLAASPRDMSMVDNRGDVSVNQEMVFNMASASNEEVFAYMEQGSDSAMRKARSLLSSKMDQ